MMLCGGIQLLVNLGEIRAELDREHQEKTGRQTKSHGQEQLQSAADDKIVWRNMITDVCASYDHRCLPLARGGNSYLKNHFML